MIDEGFMQRGLLAVERQLDASGWDQPPILVYMLALPVFGSGTLLTAIPFSIQPPEMGGHPVDALGALGAGLRAGVEGTTSVPMPPVPPILSEEFHDAFTAVGFFFEGWAAPEGFVREPGDTRTPADIVGSREARTIHAVDIRGRCFSVHRLRGAGPSKPDEIMQAVDDGVRIGHGPCASCGPEAEQELNSVDAVMIGLRDLMHAIGKQLPPGKVDLKAVDAIRTERMAHAES